MIIEQQINNLHKLAIEDVYLIAQECNEILGAVPVKKYSELLGIPERTIYDRIKKGKIKLLNGSPCINYDLNK